MRDARRERVSGVLKRRSHERFDQRAILDARCGFDPAGDIHTMRLHALDRFADVAWMESTGQRQLSLLCDVDREVPIKPMPRSSRHGSRDSRIEENAFARKRHDAFEVVFSRDANRFVGARELIQHRGRLVAVELHPIESDRVTQSLDFFRGGIHKHADDLDFWKRANDGLRHVDLNLARGARPEVEAQGIHAEIDAHGRILDRRQPANFDLGTHVKSSG